MNNLKIFFCIFFLISFFQTNLFGINCIDCMKCLLTIDCYNKISKVKRLIKLNFIDDAKKLINKVDKKGKTLLHEVCESCQLQNLKLIINYCDKNTITKQDEKGDTPLSIICNVNRPALIVNYIELNVAAKMAKILLPHYDKDSINRLKFFYANKERKNLKLIKLLTLNSIQPTSSSYEFSP